MSTEGSASDAGICGACGLCCDGTFFGLVEITPAEEPAVRRHGLPLFDHGGGLAFAQPCAAHRGDLCAAYVDRPERCVSYRCLLLRRVDAGEVGRAEALGRIAEARSSIAGILALAGAPSDARAAPPTVWAALEARSAADGPDAATPAWRRAHQAMLLETAVLTSFLRRHFEPKLRQRKAADDPAKPEGA